MKHLLTLALVLCLGTFASAQIPSYVPTNGLVGWWPFNGNANDESGNGNHGTVNGATLASDRFGNAGKAYSFDGVDDWIRLTTLINGIAGSTSATFNCWALKTQNTGGVLVSQWVTNSTPSGPIGLFYALNQNDNLSGAMIGGIDITSSRSANQTFLWNMYTIVFDNSIGNSVDKIKFYQNGNLISALPFISPTSIGNQSNIAIIGARGYQASLGSINGFFTGKIDDLVAYNRALTPAEVQQLYTGQSACNLSVNLAPSDTLAACGNSVNLNAGNPGANYLWNTADTTQSISATQSGWYSATVIQNNCSATDSVYVNLLQVDLGNDTTVCRGNSMIIAAKTPGNLNLPGNLRNGLLGYWPFNGNANDVSGNGYNGIVNGATLTTDRFGNVGNAYNFDGNDWISTNLDRAISGNISISFWFRFSNFSPGYKAIIGTYSNSPTTDFFIGKDCCVNYWGIQDGNYNGRVYQISSDLPNKWNFGTYVFDQSTSNGTFYINGTMVSTNNFSSGRGLLSFGFENESGGLFWTGDIDDIMIYNRSLSSTEIGDLFSKKPTSTLWSTGDTTPTINVTPTQTTTYYCTVSDGISTCTDSVTVFVTQPPVLTLPDTLRSATRPVVLAPGNASTYRWSTGDTTANLSVNTAGTYSVTASNAAGCSSADSVLVLFSNPAPALPAAAAGMFNYQASVVSGGKPLANRSLSVRFTVADSSATNYSEIQQITTDTRGHFATQVGAGSPISGSLSDVSWWDGLPRTLKTEVDTNGSGSWVVLGSSSLVAVPVSMYALRSGDGSRSIYGSFDSNGNVVSGRGFSVTPLGNGKFELVFQQPFTELPNVFFEITGSGQYGKKIISIQNNRSIIEISGNPDRIQFEAKGK